MRIAWVMPIDMRRNTLRYCALRELQRKVKTIGGTWYPSQKLWYAPEEYVHQAGLTERIVR